MIGGGFGNIFKIPELKSKILFTLLCLAVYRLGAHIPTAGVNVLALQQLAGQFQGTLFYTYYKGAMAAEMIELDRPRLPSRLVAHGSDQGVRQHIRRDF